MASENNEYIVIHVPGITLGKCNNQILIVICNFYSVIPVISNDLSFGQIFC